MQAIQPFTRVAQPVLGRFRTSCGGGLARVSDSSDLLGWAAKSPRTGDSAHQLLRMH